MTNRSITITVSNKDDTVSLSANGYGDDRRTAMPQMAEDLVRSLVAATPGNRIDVQVNGIPVEINGRDDESAWLRKIIG